MDLLEDGHRCRTCALTAEVAEHKAAPKSYGGRVLISVGAAIAITFALGLAVGILDQVWGTHHVEVRGADGEIHYYGLGGGSGLIYLAMFGIPPLAIATGVAVFFLLGRRRRSSRGVPAARIVRQRLGSRDGLR
jgi:hypothetical protein